LYKVKGIDPAWRRMTFACGTEDQALERAQDLTGRRFRDVVVIDPSGKETGAAAFMRLAEAY
jgi:hypothetical protein